jgi:polyisoprenoid-binding protein YceI
VIKKIIGLWILFFSIAAFADVPSWQIIPENSSLTFTAIQNNAPVSGKFTQFSGDIKFDPAELQASHIRIIVNMASVTTDYADVADTLKTVDWFNIAAFPEAVFTASDFIKTNDKSYQAKGMLTIRNKTVPAVLTFTLTEFSQTKAQAEGFILLKRLAFNIGQGEWQNTDNVKDEVQVRFKITAKK